MLVKKQHAITPHVFQQLHLSNMMNVSNFSMGNLANKSLNFLNDNILLLMVNLEAPKNHAKSKRRLHDFDESWETMQSRSQPNLVP